MNKTKVPGLDFAIIGAQKSASTFVQRALIDHPEIGMPRGETHVIEDPWYTPESFEECIANLAATFPGNRLLGIKRPDCLGLATSMERLHRHMPAGRILVILRNPIDRAVSAYYHYMRYDSLPLLDVEDGMRRILDGGIPGYPLAEKVLSYGMYGRCLARCFSLFPASRCLVMKHDEIVRDKEGALLKVYGFLGIDPGHRTRNLERRSQAVIYSMRRLAFLRLRSPFVFKWFDQRTYWQFRFGPLSKLAWYGFEAVDRYLLGRVIANRKPTLSAELRDRLADHYRTDLQEAEDLTGLDLVSWLPLSRES